MPQAATGCTKLQGLMNCGTPGGHHIFTPRGHHRGIGRAILLPYRAIIKTLLLIVIPFLLIYCVLDIGYLVFYVTLLFVATFVEYFVYLCILGGFG